MNKTYNVLIIDDHQIIIDNFKNALAIVEKDSENIKFKIDEAKCCQSAFEKIRSAPKPKGIDLFFLDLSLPPSPTDGIFSGEDLGVAILKYFPDAKIIVCTGYNDNLRLNNIIKTINPDSLLLKGDIDFNNIIESIKDTLNNQISYSQTALGFLRNKVSNSVVLCEYDIQILYEISNGARMKDLIKLIPLSKAAIEKRKRKLKLLFNVDDDSDRKLILAAREKGFI